MIRSLLLGAVCLTCSAFAQQYISSGPVPQRPTSFAGAVPVQQPFQQSGRTATIRQRPVARTFQQEPVINSRAQAIAASQQQAQPIRLRRPQNAGRARNSFNDDEEDVKQRNGQGNPDDVYLRPRAPAPTPAPTQQPLPQTTKFQTQRPIVPVEEEYIEEEEEEGTTPASISRSAYVGPYQPSQPPTPFQRPAFLQPVAFRPSPQASFPQLPNFPTSQTPVVRQFPRPQPQLRPLPQVTATPVTRPPPPPPQQNSEEEEDEPQYQRQQPLRQQPRRPVQQQQQQPESDFRPIQSSRPPQQIRQQTTVQQKEVYRPHPSKAASPGQKERKPVVQTVRKYHDENEDGSITWGYENDDGTFKEETIGIDCVTRGKYGYVDPDGVKREYSYQTGIPCDKEAEAEQAASANEGYVDYSSNKYIFPNGDEIDLDDMVKNKKRKPVGQYSQYRN